MRKDAREAVYKILFAECFNDGGIDEDFVKFIYDDCNLQQQDEEFANELLGKINENKQYLTDTISDLSKKYKLDRLYTADKCALIIGLCEIKFSDVPNIVAIDEAVSLAGKYSTETSLNFVNGVLAEYKKICEGQND